ncbi:MAG: M15 family metallopeptidase [Bacteroidia bacterium]|nr:M15 family metallopeptidase [Bacteroidia bacterium]
MRKILGIFASLLFVLSLLSWQQQKKVNPFGLEIVANIADYQKSVSSNPVNRLVDLEKAIPGIVLDIRYATSNNFTHQTIYPAPKAFLREPVVDALAKVQQELKGNGIGLKIYDAYRPYAVTIKFFEVYPDTTFVASPKTGSRHNRGCAVDLTLIDLKSGKELEMPTAFDDFTEKAMHNYMNLSQKALQDRKLLRNIMSKYGFIPYESEWWHYDFKGWKNYPIMDLSFDELHNN